MISFFLTTKCNLNCIYCYNIEEREALAEYTLPFDVARAGIDWWFATTTNRHVRFYGPGEPTREWRLMSQIVEYARQASDGVTVEIQTNGVFGPKPRSWMLDNINVMWLSFDGPPDIQNHNRPVGGIHPSAPIIEKNVVWLVASKRDRDLMVGARITITDDNSDRQVEMVDYFYGLGIRHVWTNPLFFCVGGVPVYRDPEKLAKYHFDMNTYLDHYISAYQYAKRKGMFWGSFLAVNFDGRSPFHCRACIPAPHLTPDGYVSACDMVVLGRDAHHMDCFIYGRWNQERRKFDFDEEKIAALRGRSTDSPSLAHCQQCVARYHCGGYCLGEVVNETGRLNGVPKNCAAVRRLIQEVGVLSEQYPYLHP